MRGRRHEPSTALEETRLSIPGGEASSGAIRPVYRCVANKRVVSLDPGVFACSASKLERSGKRRAGSCGPCASPCHIGLVTVGIDDDAIASQLGLLDVEIIIGPGGTLYASVVKQTLLALVTNESAAVIPDPEKMPLFDLIRFADRHGAKLADRLPILGPRRSREHQPSSKGSDGP